MKQNKDVKKIDFDNAEQISANWMVKKNFPINVQVTYPFFHIICIIDFPNAIWIFFNFFFTFSKIPFLNKKIQGYNCETVGSIARKILEWVIKSCYETYPKFVTLRLFF